MPELGYGLSTEEHGPQALVDDARRAEEAGLTHALISDHFHPWIGKQGHSSFAWTALGGIAEATDDLRLGTGVTCPTMRYHPAIVAQAAATAGAMFDGRFFLGLGTGERLNEQVVGEHWPPHHVRLDMLAEAIEVMRKLWTGEVRSHEGEHYTLENARLFTLPEEPPPVYVAAEGEDAARAAADLGEGFISTVPEKPLVETFEEAGGEGPRYGQFTTCWAEDERQARQTAHEYWPIAGMTGELNQELATPTHFEQAAQMVTEDEVAKKVVLGPDPDGYVERIQEYADAGFDHVYVHQVGPEQEGFLEFFEREVMPSF